MPKSSDDILLRLESTISGWSEEVVTAHSRLTHQITDTKEQLSALLKIIATRSKSGPALDEALEQAAQLKGELEQRDETIASLNEAGQDSDAKAQELAQTLANLNAENDDLRGQLEHKESTRQALETEAGRQAAEAATLAERVQALSAQMDALNLESASVLEQEKAREAENASLRAQRDESGAALEALQEERDALAQSGEEAQEKLQALHDQLSETAETQGRLDSESESLAQELARTKTALDETRGQLQSNQEALDALKSTLKDKESALEGAMAEAGAFLKELESRTQAEAVTARRLAELENLEEEERTGRQQAEEEHDALKEELARERANTEQLRTELDSVRTLKETTDEDLRLASDSLDALRLRENQKETALSGELEAAQEATQAELARREAAQLAVEDELHQARNRLNELQTKLESRDDSERECVRLTETVGALKAEIERHKRQFSALDQARDTHSFQTDVDEMEVDELRLELRTHRALVRDRKESVEAFEADRHRLETSKNESDAACQQATEKLQELRDAFASREKAVLANEARIAEIEHALRSSEDRSRVLSEQCDEMRQNARLLEEAQREIDRLKQALARRDETLNMLQGQEDATPAPVEAERIPLAAYDARGRKRSMGEILVNAGIITEKQLESALEEQRSSKQRRLGTILIEKGLIQEQVVAQVLASQLKLPFVEIGDTSLEPEVVNLISGDRATHHMCIPMILDSEGLTLAMANPLDVVAIEDIEIIAGHTILPVVATLADITSAIVRHYGSHTAIEPLQAPLNS